MSNRQHLIAAQNLHDHKGKTMMKRMASCLAIGLMAVSAFCAPSMAQTPGAGSADSERNYDLLPGLDKHLIDTSANPCVDFFQYACGNFPKLYPIPSDRSAFGTGAMIAEHTQHVLHTVLERAAAGGADRNPNEQKIGDNYAACMDVDAINQKGLKSL
jgi:endothelin-converting enzyme/putative endopeptidase